MSVTASDWTDPFTWVLVEDTWLVEAVRYTIMVLAGLEAALLGRAYLDNRTGRMNRMAAIGAVMTYFTVAFAQPRAILLGDPDLSLLNLLVLTAMVISLAGTWPVVDLHLFKGKKK